MEEKPANLFAIAKPCALKFPPVFDLKNDQDIILKNIFCLL